MKRPSLQIGHDEETLPRHLDRDRVWRGVEGLADLRRTVPCSTLDASAFYAEIQHLRHEGLQIFDWYSNEMWASISSRPASAVDLGLVLSGSARITCDGAHWEAGPGEVYLLRPGRDRAWWFAEGTSIRTLILEAEEPGARGRAPVGPLRPSLLHSAFIDVLAALSEHRAPRTRAATSTSVRAIAYGLIDEQCA